MEEAEVKIEHIDLKNNKLIVSLTLFDISYSKYFNKFRKFKDATYRIIYFRKILKQELIKEFSSTDVINYIYNIIYDIIKDMNYMNTLVSKDKFELKISLKDVILENDTIKAIYEVEILT